MRDGDEAKKIKMTCVFFIIVMLLRLIIPIYSIYIPYFTIKTHNISLFNYTFQVYQEMPAAIIALLVESVVNALVLIIFFGVYQLKEKVRKSLIFTLVVGLAMYILIFVVSKIVGQRSPFPMMECLIYSVLVYSFTRQKIKEQFQ